MRQKLTIYTDGGARGNPGLAAIGVVFPELGKSYHDTIGETTNNIAEYRAIILALKKAKHLLGGDKAAEADLEIRSDSELAINQLSAKYKIKDEDLKPLFIDVWNAMQDFKSVKFTHVPREENTQADKLVNQALDTLL